MKLKSSFAAALIGATAFAAPAWAQVSNDFVKIGVLPDMSGLTADITGKGSLVAAEMAVQEFGGIATNGYTQARHLDEALSASLEGWFRAFETVRR